MPNASDDQPPGPASAVATVEQPMTIPNPWRPRPAKVVIKPDLLPAVIMLLTIPTLGMAVGWLWSRLAPPQRMRVLAEGLVPLPVESYHRFDNLALFTLLCLGAGLATGVGVWFLRERRGPVVLIAAVLGSAGAAYLAMRTGVGFAGGRFAVSGTPQVGDVVLRAPMIESTWAVLAWPLTTALGYGLLAAWNGMDDLGRRLG